MIMNEARDLQFSWDHDTWTQWTLQLKDLPEISIDSILASMNSESGNTQKNK